jgi:hypothetical protein
MNERAQEKNEAAFTRVNWGGRIELPEIIKFLQWITYNI